MMTSLTEEQKEHAMMIFKRLLDGEPVHFKDFIGNEIPLTPENWVLTKFVERAYEFYVPKPKQIGVPDGFWEMLDPKWKGIFIDKYGSIIAGTDKPTERSFSTCRFDLLDIRLFDIDGVDPKTSWTPRPEEE